MTKKRRRIIFYTLLLLFILAGASVILYVNGWRFNFTTFRLGKVGAIYVRSYPPQANMYLGGRSVENKSGFFQKGTFVSDLFPKNYKLKLTLDGYETWEENVPVLPSLVSEVKYAVLIPENSRMAATGTFKNFWLLGSGALTENAGNNLLYDGKKIGAGSAAGWTSDFKNILIHNEALGSYSLYNTDTASSTDVNLLLKKSKFNTKQDFEVFADSEDKRTLIVRQQNKLYALNIGEPSLTSIYKTNLELGEKIVSSQFYYAWTEWNVAENTSTLVVYDKFLQRIRPELPELHGKNSELEWINGTNESPCFRTTAVYTPTTFQAITCKKSPTT